MITYPYIALYNFLWADVQVYMYIFLGGLMSGKSIVNMPLQSGVCAQVSFYMPR